MGAARPTNICSELPRRHCYKYYIFYLYIFFKRKSHLGDSGGHLPVGPSGRAFSFPKKKKKS